MPGSFDLSKELTAFGLNEVETKIYLHLLNNPPQTMLDLSRQLAIPRTSIYDNAQRLIEKGLLEKVVTFKSQKIKAYPIEMLKLILDRKKSELELLESSFKTIEKNITQFAGVVGATEVRYYRGKEGMQQMMWNSLKAEKDVVGYSVFGRVEIVGMQFEKRYAEEFRNLGLVDRVITNPTKDILATIERYIMPKWHHITDVNIRTLPMSKLYVSGDTAIYNDTFAVLYWKKGEIVGVEIDNAEFVKTQKSIFELLWNIAEPIKLN